MARKQHQVLKGPGGNLQVLLTRDVPKLGQQGEIVQVKPGYARNYLLPQGFATAATPHNMKLAEKHQKKLAALVEARRAEVQKLADALGRDKFPIDAEMIRLEGPLKELGLYTVKLQLAQGVDSEVKVWVVPATH